MNVISGFSLAATTISASVLNPAATITLYPDSMNASMPARYCEASAGTNTGGSAAPTASAPATAPAYLYSLKFLSLTVPTSVTTAMRQSPSGAGGTDTSAAGDPAPGEPASGEPAPGEPGASVPGAPVPAADVP